MFTALFTMFVVVATGVCLIGTLYISPVDIFSWIHAFKNDKPKLFAHKPTAKP